MKITMTKSYNKYFKSFDIYWKIFQFYKDLKNLEKISDNIIVINSFLSITISLLMF